MNKLLLYVVPIALCLFAFQNCGGGGNYSNTSSSSSPSAAKSLLAITPAAPTVSTNGTQPFSVSGGTPPYQFTASNNCGSFNSQTGLYTAPVVGGNCVITVSDAKSSATAVVTVLQPTSVASVTQLLASQPTSNAIYVNSTVAINVAGGTPPYTYSKVSGLGTIISNIYQTTSLSETMVTLLVSDSSTPIQKTNVTFQVLAFPAPVCGTQPNSSVDGCTLSYSCVSGAWVVTDVSCPSSCPYVDPNG